MNTARFRHSSPILLLLTVVLTGSLAAQADSRNDPNPDREVLELRVGSRVRVTTLDGTPPRVGRADTLDPTGLRVRTTEDGTSWIPADAIRRLEVRLERRSFEDRLRPGVVAGGIVGLLGGLIAAHLLVEDCSGSAWCFEGLERALVISAGTVGGVIVGGAISVAAVPGESWGEARLPRMRRAVTIASHCARLDSVPGYGVYDVRAMTTLTTGRLARRAGVNVETVRYYERRGLLPEPPRTEGGYRQYDPQAVRRIRFIKRAQELGFTLDEIGDLLALRVAPRADCDAVERRAARAMDRIDTKIAELERMRAPLRRLLSACRERRPTEECPILDALEPGLDAVEAGENDIEEEA